MSEKKEGGSPTTPVVQVWRSFDPWLRFGFLAVLTLIIAAFIPPWSEQTPTSSATTSTAPPPSFGFTGDDFLVRWNAVGIDDQLTVSAYDQETADEKSFRILITEHDIEWTVRVAVDPLTEEVRRVELHSPVSVSGSNEFGALVIIATLEGAAPAEAQETLTQILDLAESAAGEGDLIDVSVSGDRASYRMAISPEIQFLFQATP